VVAAWPERPPVLLVEQEVVAAEAPEVLEVLPDVEAVAVADKPVAPAMEALPGVLVLEVAVAAGATGMIVMQMDVTLRVATRDPREGRALAMRQATGQVLHQRFLLIIFRRAAARRAVTVLAAAVVAAAAAEILAHAAPVAVEAALLTAGQEVQAAVAASSVAAVAAVAAHLPFMLRERAQA
jgi:hypothetical protein